MASGRKVGEVFVEVRANLSKLKAGMKSAISIASGGASVIGKVLGGLASLIKNVLTAAFKVVGAVIKTIFKLVTTLFSSMIKWAKRGVLALTAFVALSVVVGAKFGHSMARVHALTGATTKEFKTLREEARRLGRVTEYSANQAADAMSVFAMAGFNTTDIITSMTPTLDFAAASGLDIAQAADIAARVMGGMQIEAKDLAHTMDVLTKAFTSANMDAIDLGEAMKFVGAVGKTVGKDVVEVVGSLTALAAAGNRGSMAGAGLRMVLVGLATSKVQKKIAALGVSVTDVSGQMKPMSKLIGDINRATGHLSDMEVADLGVQLFGARGGVAFLQLIGQGEDAIEKFTTSLANVDGWTKKIAATQRDTLAVAFQIVQSAIADVMITITDILEPTLRGAADSQVNMWNKIGEVLEFNKNAIQGFIQNTIDWLKDKLPAAINVTVGAIVTLFDKVKQNFDSLVSVGETASGLMSDFFEVKSLKGTVFDKVIQAAGIAFIKIRNMIKDVFGVILAQVKLILEQINTTMNEQRWSNKFKKLWGGTKKVARTIGAGVAGGFNPFRASETGKKIGGIWGEGSLESEDVTAGRARERTLQHQLDRAMRGTSKEQEDKEIERFIESIVDPDAKKRAREAAAKKDKEARDKHEAKKTEDALARKARRDARSPNVLDLFPAGGGQEIFRDPAAPMRPMGGEKRIGDPDFFDREIDWDNLPEEHRRLIVTAEGGGKTLGEGFEEKGETFLDGLKKIFLPTQKPEMSRVGKGFFQGELDLFGFKKMGHDAAVAAGKIKKGEGRKIDPTLAQPKLVMAGFASTIQTAIGSAKVGAPDIWEKIERSNYRQETSANRIARLAQEAKELAQETADNTKDTADNTKLEPIT
jgi:TP901 family phage tail tape measure protein